MVEMRGLRFNKSGDVLLLHCIKFHRRAHDRIMAVYRSSSQAIEFFFEHLVSYDSGTVVHTKRLFKRAAGIFSGDDISMWMLATETFDSDSEHAAIGVATGECVIVDLTRIGAPNRLTIDDDGVGHLGIPRAPFVLCLSSERHGK